MEVVVVMAILLILAAVVIPSVSAIRGDTRQRAAADAIRGELATARSRAREEARPYRVAISEDGRRIRREPDGAEFGSTPAAEGATASATAVEYAFEDVTAEVVGGSSDPMSGSGWVTVAVLLPDGTCRDDNVLVNVKEDGRGSLQVHVRGLTGSSRVVTTPNTSGGTP